MEKLNSDIRCQEIEFFKELKGIDPIFVEALGKLGYNSPTPI